MTIPAHSQDFSPLKNHHVWLPMTGVTQEQMDDAVRAGYDTMMLKIHPPLVKDGTGIDFSVHEATIRSATERGLKLLLAILGWVGLGDGEFWDVREDGSIVRNRLDPFHHEAMKRVEWYYGEVMDHYAGMDEVIAFAPTWGIYGEAGFTCGQAGRSPHALARFNEWRVEQGLPPLEALPKDSWEKDTEWNRFVRFRYLYLQSRFDPMISRLKARSNGKPVGMWQELYPIVGYLWTFVRIPNAEFALYESAFPFQTTHDNSRTLAETMGLRYQCESAEDYRDYYLPLVARKRGDGQRFMGCQLSNHYAIRNFGWSEEKTEAVRFDQWEDDFSPYLRDLMAAPLERPNRDVLLVFPDYAASALTGHPRHSADAMIIDVLLRMYGCQMVRIGSPTLDGLSVEDMNRYRLIIVPSASYLMPETWEKLKKTIATVLFTGTFARAFDAVQVPFGESRELDGMTISYAIHPGGEVVTIEEHPLTRDLPEAINGQTIRIPEDETFQVENGGKDIRVLLRCEDRPLLTTLKNDRRLFLHGSLFADLSHNPDRKPTIKGGSADPSANAHDMWGPYCSENPQNLYGRLLMKNILDHAGVDYRVPDPLPRTFTPYLGDHMEQASISANIAYNNTAETQTLTLRLPYAPLGFPATIRDGRFHVRVAVPAFSYVALVIPPRIDGHGWDWSAEADSREW